MITPDITRAYWSRRRAWQGEEIKLFIEARHLKDGTPLTVEIWEDGTDENQGDDLVAKVPGNHRFKGNRCTIDYRITWDPASLGKDLTLEGDSFVFYFLVTIAKPALKKKSDLLYVDLHTLRISV